MSPEEATDGAAERHEFRCFEWVILGNVEVVRFVCYDGCPSADYPTTESARNAHERHQAKETGRDAMQRSYTPRLHP
jgi:hypothetical protein